MKINTIQILGQNQEAKDKGITPLRLSLHFQNTGTSFLFVSRQEKKDNIKDKCFRGKEIQHFLKGPNDPKCLKGLQLKKKPPPSLTT